MSILDPPGFGAHDIRAFIDLTQPLLRLGVFLEIECRPNTFLQILDTEPWYIHDRQVYMIPYDDTDDPPTQPDEEQDPKNSASHEPSTEIGSGTALGDQRGARPQIDVAGRSVPSSIYPVGATFKVRNQAEKLTSTIQATGGSHEHVSQPAIPRAGQPPNPTTSANQASDPSIEFTDGLYVLHCPQDCHQRRCRVVILLSIDIFDAHLQELDGPWPPGWHTWVIPGLPSLPEGKEPSLTYVFPRGRMIEINKPLWYYTGRPIRGWLDSSDRRDMRDCEGSFYFQYRDVDDFMVEQKVQVRDSDQGLVYCVMCAFRFTHRIIKADRCRFTIEVEDGPEGEFECFIEAPEDTLPVIRIPSGEATTDGNSEYSSYQTASRADTSQTDESRAGICRVEITCSPGPFELFCLTWEIPPTQNQVNLPFMHAPLTKPSQDARDWLETAMDTLSPMITPSPRKGHPVRPSERKSTFVQRLRGRIIFILSMIPIFILHYIDIHQAVQRTPMAIEKARVDLVQSSEHIGPGEATTGIEQSTSIPGLSTSDPGYYTSEETAAPDAEPNVSENTAMLEPSTPDHPGHSSFRDLIDYSLGWKGPTTPTETYTPSTMNHD